MVCLRFSFFASSTVASGEPTVVLFWAYTRLNTTESLKRMLQRVGAQRGTADAELLILAFEEGKEISEEEREQALKDVKYDCVGDGEERVCTPIESAAFDWPTHRPHIYRLDEDFSAESATRFASKFADRELWYRREGGIDEHGNRKMKLTFWAPFAIAFDVVFTLLVLYLLYKAVRWALGRGGGAAPAAEAKGGKAKAKAQ